jgi:small subunit ribosomal protein S1
MNLLYQRRILIGMRMIAKDLVKDILLKDRDALLKKYEGTVTSVNESELVVGIVVGINNRDVILNIGFKSDGLVPLAEFKDQPSLKIGDSVDLFIEERENAMGQLVLSRRKAKLLKGWENVQKGS